MTDLSVNTRIRQPRTFSCVSMSARRIVFAKWTLSSALPWAREKSMLRKPVTLVMDAVS